MKNLILMALALCLWWGCKRELPALSFFSVTMEKAEVVEIGLYTVTGRVDDLNQENVEQCGFVWSMDEDSIQQFPDALDRIVVTPPAGNGTFSTPFAVHPGQTWYLRAFAIQGARKVYSKNIRLLNLGAIVEMTGNAVVSNNHAIVQGLLTGIDSLAQTVATYGHVYSATNDTPALGASDCDTTRFLNGNADGAFTSHLTGLNFNTSYHVRAYATDGNQIFYSERVDTFRIRDGWEQISNFPNPFADGTAVANGNGFAYAGFGTNNSDGPASDILKEFWRFNPASGGWQEMAPFSNDPILKRTNTSMFTIGDTVYVIFGQRNVSGGTQMVRNFWKYAISTNTWGEEVDIDISQNIFGSRSGAVGFVLGEKFYVGAGHRYQGGNLVYENDFWEYNPQTGGWTKVKSLPMRTLNGESMNGRFEAVGFASDEHGFVGGGEFGGLLCTDFWRFTPPGAQDSGKWELVAQPFPGDGRIDALSFTIGDKAYYGCGYNLALLGLSDFYEFDMKLETWTRKTPFQGGGRFRMLGFSANGFGYGGCGIELSSSLPIIHQDFWRYTPEKS